TPEGRTFLLRESAGCPRAGTVKSTIGSQPTTSLECGDPAPLWMSSHVTSSSEEGRSESHACGRVNGEEHARRLDIQSGAGSPHSKGVVCWPSIASSRSRLGSRAHP